MSDLMNIEAISPADLPSHATAMKGSGYRLVQICATRLSDGGFELTYSFGREPECLHFRIVLPKESPTAPSISGAYWGSFPYENEIHDLFGVTFEGMNINYNGTFYKTSIPKPFAEAPCVIPTTKKT